MKHPHTAATIWQPLLFHETLRVHTANDVVAIASVREREIGESGRAGVGGRARSSRPGLAEAKGLSSRTELPTLVVEPVV